MILYGYKDCENISHLFFKHEYGILYTFIIGSPQRYGEGYPLEGPYYIVSEAAREALLVE